MKNFLSTNICLTIVTIQKRLSLKRRFGGCKHGFGRCDGPGGLGRFNGLGGFGEFDRLGGFDRFSGFGGFLF